MVVQALSAFGWLAVQVVADSVGVRSPWAVWGRLRLYRCANRRGGRGPRASIRPRQEGPPRRKFAAEVCGSLTSGCGQVPPGTAPWAAPFVAGRSGVVVVLVCIAVKGWGSEGEPPSAGERRGVAVGEHCPEQADDHHERTNARSRW
jgi:hypothetical protein